MTKLKRCATALFLAGATPALADQVIADDLIVSKGAATLLCLGTDCVNGESFSETFGATLRLKATNTLIEFDDTSGSALPDRDWKIQANATSGGAAGERFIIGDVTAGTEPFGIAGGAQSNALYVAANGNIGMGTAIPQADIHMTSFDTPRIRLEQLAGTFSPQTWEIRGSEGGLGFRDSSLGTLPFIVRSGAPSLALDVRSNGDVGIGADPPAGKLHTRGAGTQLVYFESSDGGAVQLRFRTNSENRRFLAVNNANQVKSQIVFGDNQIQFLGQTVAQEWLRISSAGIVSSGPTCNPNPCDATFDPEAFTVPPIEERAALMWENMHLPAIGPTEPGKPFNLTEKTAGMLHELEIAHIYIGQLHERLEEQVASQSDLQARIEDQERQMLLMQTEYAQAVAELTARLDRMETR